MKKVLKFLGFLLLILIIGVAIFYFINNEKLPTGKQGTEADELANKMLSALNYEDYKNTEILEWSFRNEHHYRWIKRENIVIVKWDDKKVHLHLNNPERNFVQNSDSTIVKNPEPKIFKQAQDYFNNDSFWLVAPYKVFDPGTERRIVKHNNKDALLITYTSGGTTPGDSYLWILDDNYKPVSYKMWTKIIPIGGIEATWNHWKKTETGIQLPTQHTIPLFGLEIDMGDVKAMNTKADLLANSILKAINHEAYKNTRYLEWSFGGRRSYKWDKKAHIADVSWDTIRVNLYPNNLDKSTVYFNDKLQEKTDTKIVERAEKLFNNDSFWLVAPHKLFERGIIRSLKKVDGKDALLVKYTVGGTTPGDSYLWILDENNIPKSYKMYVPSMKMDGVPATWEDWITTESSTLLPKNHKFGNGGNLSMGDVKGYN
ncbi:hypothetical protein WH52_00580 [Tenacibaculum holothuriorum]|uniref:Uncharacterized protein n=1 Tax=Tenacibaculum holothuriorum TaxID=1635173 RepID=A0A1Y2PFB3_9FLAO|nr:hypothetical protein [Tenacibaculum holothuriorum]OSY89186.1 hypothetical protein WH52_00580 [Tenacibaculum holothuriorum]